MKKHYDIGAYYWPAYHDEPRWRRFMPKGEGEWQTVRETTPKFEGHMQPRVPLWGYESESDPRVMEKKIDAAASHGVIALFVPATGARRRSGADGLPSNRT